MYFAQGRRFAYSGFPLFNDPIEAWRYGPVILRFRINIRKC
ncbi:MAG: DUF4065 domain-containing protein [Deltaproteobacteria bacterium]|nr:DUF4065 domain-containing protein [Deltaproteobacteria bacterium]